MSARIPASIFDEYALAEIDSPSTPASAHRVPQPAVAAENARKRADLLAPLNVSREDHRERHNRAAAA